MSTFRNLRLENQLCFALYAATNAIVRFYTARLSELGLTYPQYLVLIVLWEREGVSVKQLAGVLNLDSSTLTPILKRLEKTGFIRRERSQDDERVVNLYLTQHAMDVQKSVAQIQKKVACQTGLPDDEFVALRDKLHELVRAMDVGSNQKERAA